MLHDRFGRDQHEVLFRQLFHIRQSGTVADYVECFSALVDQLAAYDTNDNPLHYTMCFVDGLREDIKPMVMVQRPSTLDSACALALVQEEAVDSNKKFSSRKYDSFYSRGAAKSVGSVPVPVAVSVDKQIGVVGSSDDKLKALKQYRRARGLCDRCAVKLVQGHKCAPTVQLHVMQELWDLFSEDENVDSPAEVLGQSDAEGQICVSLSEAGATGQDSTRSMRLLGEIQGNAVLILIDSGSSHSFLSTKIAELLDGSTPLLHPLTVAVANGHSMQCQSQFERVTWAVQGYEFQSDLKVLPLLHYDMIVGYDWLEKFSPMRVHWGAKWMAIPLGGRTVVLQGILSELLTGDVIQVCQLADSRELSAAGDVPGWPKEIPPVILELLSEYEDVFASKVEFPPPRSCSHTIPLLPRARPVSIRPYRYAPVLKDEIEKQV
jgi:hypothetical protein